MDWTKILSEDHKRNHEGGEWSLVLGPKATKSDISELVSLFGRFTPPSELLDLYCCHNGVGIHSNDGGVRWSFVPIQELKHFISQNQEMLTDTHPEVAIRYFPFYDWMNGDSVGYLWDTKDRRLTGLYELSNELYRYDSTQNWNDFMIARPDSIAELILA